MLEFTKTIGQKITAENRRILRKCKRFIDPKLNAYRYKKFKRKFRTSQHAVRFSEGENTFLLYRIIGNALPPRHEPSQVLDNLAFQLANESQLENCEKYWIINRIFDNSVRQRVIALLEEYGAAYFEIEFEEKAYRQISTAEDTAVILDLIAAHGETLDAEAIERAELAKLRQKRLYIMNNNGARNTAIEHGRSRAKWILPWDGNCFLTPTAWKHIVASVVKSQHLPYHIVPMTRMTDNSLVADEIAGPEANEEPQIIFHRESADVFDNAIPYGRRPKIELLDRIGLWGVWKRWMDDPWDVGKNNKSDFVHAYAMSEGWVYRLSSGKPQLEVGAASEKKRMLSRNEAIIAAVEHVDKRYSATSKT